MTGPKIRPEPLNAIDEEVVRSVLAREPLMAVVTYEEFRFLTQLQPIQQELRRRRAENLQQQLARASDRAKPEANKEIDSLRANIEKVKTEFPVVSWSYTRGLRLWEYTQDGDQWTAKSGPVRVPHLNPDEERNPVAVLLALLDSDRPNPSAGRPGGIDLASAVFVFCDIHPWFDREDRMGRFNHMAMRALRDLVQRCKLGFGPRGLILLGPYVPVPFELRNDLQVFDYPLPDADQLEARFQADAPGRVEIFGPACIDLDDEDRPAFIRALTGLTYEQAAGVIARALVTDGRIGTEHIDEALTQKRQIIQKDGMLDYFQSRVDFDDVGGLDVLRTWLVERKKAFDGETVKFTMDGKEVELPLPAPRGILLIGVPGGGKSLFAKAIGREWRLPLLRLDVGRIFGSYIGESEKNMRNAIRVAESVAPAIVWLDEIEKAFPKTSGSTDSGVAVRVMGTFLTWMQEHTKPVFTVATGNDVNQLPPELTRKGRFDEIFYAGLPDAAAREKIFEIHTRALPLDRSDLQSLVEATQWFTGAEIEQVVKNGLFRLGVHLQQAQPPRGGNPVLRAILECAAELNPLAARVGDDARNFVAGLLVKAAQIGRAASTAFEAPPP